MSAPRILLLTGASGFVGRRLLPGLERSWQVVTAGRTAMSPAHVPLDLADADTIGKIVSPIRPSAIVHAGGIADPDTCERDPGLAQRVNSDAVEALALYCRNNGARLVHFSTDLVFDGKRSWYEEQDPVRPLSAYGSTKVASEQAALRAPRSVVLRIAASYGRSLGGRTSFVDFLHSKLANGQPVDAFVDQWRTPTPADQLPRVIQAILDDEALHGVYHWGGADRMSRHEMALCFCRTMGFDEALVRRASATEHPFLAARPEDTSLRSTKLSAALRIEPLRLADGYASLRSASQLASRQ